MALATDTTLGSYKIESLIGRGGMGEVYRARDTGLNRSVRTYAEQEVARTLHYTGDL